MPGMPLFTQAKGYQAEDGYEGTADDKEQGDIAPGVAVAGVHTRRAHGE